MMFYDFCPNAELMLDVSGAGAGSGVREEEEAREVRASFTAP